MVKGLYAITNEALMPGDFLLRKTEAALAGGCRLVQYRNKLHSLEQQHKEATLLRGLCERYGALLIINDSVDLALAIGADGVHLGQEDQTSDAARQQLGPSAIVGATCHASVALARTACDTGADYLAFGRFFPSQTKPNAPPAPLSLLADVKQHLHLPMVAIGGINVDNAGTLIAAGADSLAVSNDLFRGDDLEQIRQRAARYVSLFNTAQEPQ